MHKEDNKMKMTSQKHFKEENLLSLRPNKLIISRLKSRLIFISEVLILKTGEVTVSHLNFW